MFRIFPRISGLFTITYLPPQKKLLSIDKKYSPPACFTLTYILANRDENLKRFWLLYDEKKRQDSFRTVFKHSCFLLLFLVLLRLLLHHFFCHVYPPVHSSILPLPLPKPSPIARMYAFSPPSPLHPCPGGGGGKRTDSAYLRDGWVDGRVGGRKGEKEKLREGWGRGGEGVLTSKNSASPSASRDESF